MATLPNEKISVQTILLEHEKEGKIIVEHGVVIETRT